MLEPRHIHELLLDYGNSPSLVQEILIGLTWTLCRGKVAPPLRVDPSYYAEVLLIYGG